MLFLNREQSNAAGLQQHPDKHQQSFQSVDATTTASSSRSVSNNDDDDDLYSVRSKLDPLSQESASSTQWPTLFNTISAPTSSNTSNTHYHHHHRIRSSMPFAVSAVSAFTTLVLLTVAGHAANASDLTSSSGDPSSISGTEAFSANSSSSSGGWSEGPMSDEQRSVYNRLMEVEFGSSVIPRRPRRSPIYQNEFAVYIPSGEEAADAVAGKYGFTNRGQVSFNAASGYFDPHQIIKMNT